MFQIGPAEIIVILLIALLVVGPKRLPEVGRSIGKGFREFRRATDEVRYSFEAQLDEEPEPLEEAKRPEDEKRPKDAVSPAPEERG